FGLTHAHGRQRRRTSPCPGVRSLPSARARFCFASDDPGRNLLLVVNAGDPEQLGSYTVWLVNVGRKAKEATMTSMHQEGFTRHWKEIASGLLKLGTTAYGGPAIMGIMQAELQEKRHWVPKERFVEGLSLVNMVPGATATQLGIFLGHARGG